VLVRLRQLVGDPLYEPGAMPAAPESWPRLEDEVLADESFGFSPLLKRLRFESRAAAEDARVARASILPQLSGQYSYSEFLGHRVGLVLRAQSEGGLSRFSAADAARQRAQSVQFQIETGERQLRNQVYALLREYEASSTRLPGSLAAAAASQRVTDSYMRQFISGRRTWLDVMNVLREAATADIDALDARVSAQSSLARLLLLSGLWSPAERAEDAR